jgi:hypothetical protein
VLPAIVWAGPPALGGGPPAGGPPGGPGKRDKKEGPAEEAPKDKQALKPIEPVPAEPIGRRRIQLFELHGYMRLRADYFHRLNLGLDSTLPPQEDAQRPNKFFEPPAQTPECRAPS